MLGILLTILKVIGIILLILFALILLIIVLVLFVPVRYKAQGYYRGDYKLDAKISWLLHILCVNAVLVSGQAFRLIIRVFGIPVYDSSKPHKAVRSKKYKNAEENKPELHAASVEPETCSKSRKTDNPETVPQPDERIHKNNPETDERKEDSMDYDTASDSSDKSTIFQKIKKLIRNIVQFLQNIKYTIQKIYDTIVNIKSNIHYYCDLLSQESTRAAFRACTKQLRRIFRNLKPGKWRIYLHIGMEDPASMGDILGVWGMFYPLHEGHIELEPDFENTVLEGEFFVKGRITVYVYLWTVCIILFDKNIKHLKKCLLREEG